MRRWGFGVADARLAGVGRPIGLLLALAIGACNGERPLAGPTAVRDSLGVRITTTDTRRLDAGPVYAAVADTLARIGTPDDQPGSETLFRVAAARFLPNGRLVVLQGGTELRFFDEMGALVSVAGREGEGPGEYLQATGLRGTVTGELAVWDASLGRLSMLSDSGAFVGSERLDMEAVGIRFPAILPIRPESRWHLVDENRLLLFLYSFSDMPEEGSSRPTVSYTTLTVDELEADTLGEYGGIEQTRVPGAGQRVVVSLDPEDTHYAVAEATGHIYVGDGGREYIDRFSPAGVLDQRIELVGLDREPVPHLIAESSARLLDQLERGGLENMGGAVASLAAIEDAPTLRGLVTDDRGSVWVRWGQQPDATGVQYGVFDTQGLFAGTARLPTHERVLDVSQGRVVVLHRSGLGVETLAIYRLEYGQP